MMTKAIPMLMAAVVTNVGVKELKPIFEKSKTSSCQTEMQHIARAIRIEAVSESGWPTAETFSDFLRKNVRQTAQKNDSGRLDVSQDLWGSFYKLEIAGNIYRVLSAGPDKSFGTIDDLSVSVNL